MNDCATIDDCLEALEKIDHAQFMQGVIKTPFGITTLENVSTGCKTVLSYFWIKKMATEGNLESVIQHPINEIVLNLTECGANAILYLFRKIGFNEPDLDFLLMHCSDIIIRDDERGNFIINGVKKKGLVL